jgi:hypothetical protein
LTPAEIISEANRLGVALHVDGSDIVHRGPRGALTPDLRNIFMAHKCAIIAELRRRDLTTAACPCPTDVAERAALIAEGDGCRREESDRRALAEHGFPSWQALADAHRAEIATALERLPTPFNEKGRRLPAATEQFVASPWFTVALENGWTMLELFGIDNYAPLDHCEQWGLVTGLALAPRAGDTIDSIDGEQTIIRYRGRSKSAEATRIERRFAPADNSVPWWECNAIQGNNIEDWAH